MQTSVFAELIVFCEQGVEPQYVKVREICAGQIDQNVMVNPPSTTSVCPVT